MGLKTVVFSIVLIVVLFVSIIATVEWWLSEEISTPEFYVGVEFAYSDNVDDLKALVDKVKDYTNLLVLGAVQMSFNQTALTESCDYMYDAELSFIILFTDTTLYSSDQTPAVWIVEARQKYGDKFLGVYRYDEPGGNQLDQGRSRLISRDNVAAIGNYSNAAKHFVNNLHAHLEPYLAVCDRVYTSDYGLYWFDYEAGYNTVFAEFGANHSRPLTIGLCRGAATAQNKSWGTIVTWTYNEIPYLESGDKLYSDLKLTYDSGAEYAVVFSYPILGSYGTLKDEHFDALQKFWDYMLRNPGNHGSIKDEVAYVLPTDYGFGFRSATDTIWGLWNADELSAKVWSDVNTLIGEYGSHLDIVYDDAKLFDAVKGHYDRLFFWNETIS